MLPMHLLVKKQFISVATCSLNGQPNAAPKLIFAIDEKYIYLVDYTAGKTWENLKVNPKISLSLSDPEELLGYKIDGSVQILENQKIPKAILKKLEDRKLSLSVDRVIRGIQQKKKYKHFELGIPDKCVVYKVKIEEVTEIGPRGDLRRETRGKNKAVTEWSI